MASAAGPIQKDTPHVVDVQPGNPGDELGERVNRGLRFAALNQVINRIFTFGSGVVVLRVLSVRDVGTYALALAIVTLVIAVNELGLIPTIIRWEDNPEHAARTAYTLVLVSSLIWYVAIFFTAPVLASAFGNGEVTGVLRVLGLTVLIDGCSSMPAAFLNRGFHQDRMAVAESSSMVVQIAVTIGLALWGAGPYALAWGQVTSNGVAVIFMILLVQHRSRPGWHRPHVGPLLRFGSPIAGGALMREGAVNVDGLVVGGVLGSIPLGFYQLAFNLGSLPQNTIGATLTRVLYAGFARLQGDKERFDNGVRRATALIVAGTVPMVVLIAALAEPIVQFLYGDKWDQAIPVLRLLVILGGMRVLLNALLDIIVADGRPRHLFALYGVWLAAVVPALFIGAEMGGIAGVAVAHLVVAVGIVLPLVLWAIHTGGIDAYAMVRTFIRPLVAGAVALVVAYLPTMLSIDQFFQLAIGGTAGVIAYAAILLPRNPLIKLPLDKLKRRRPVEAPV
ncbi:MAG: polysaccharide biosynthesis protein [Actinomycetia bacterium]|nr:polysaccharide biosynthesis protein [Actinomycetes bacterium]